MQSIKPYNPLEFLITDFIKNVTFRRNLYVGYYYQVYLHHILIFLKCYISKPVLDMDARLCQLVIRNPESGESTNTKKFPNFSRPLLLDALRPNVSHVFPQTGNHYFLWWQFHTDVLWEAVIFQVWRREGEAILDLAFLYHDASWLFRTVLKLLISFGQLPWPTWLATSTPVIST